MLRDELRDVWGWSDVSREGWKQVKGGQEACDDVVGRPPGYGSAISFENKFYKTGFDKYYTLSDRYHELAVVFPEGDMLLLSKDPNKALESKTHLDLECYPPDQQKVMRSLVKKCRDWAGNAQILSLKQNGKPFLYCRFRR